MIDHQHRVNNLFKTRTRVCAGYTFVIKQFLTEPIYTAGFLETLLSLPNRTLANDNPEGGDPTLVEGLAS